ncbi:nSTAND1 domain-containing NTPase [Nostoc sp. UIC 10890]
MAKINRSLAIVIGIDQYTHIRKLKSAVNDAKEIADVLEKRYKYKVLRLLDGEATNENLSHLLKNLAHETNETNKTIQIGDERIQVGKSDRILFYFAGHGFPEETEESEDGKPAGYLMPQDSQQNDKRTWLSMQKLHDALTNLECRHLLMILDCCFAGRILWAGLKRNAGRSRKMYRQSYDRFTKFPAQQVITSAAHDEEAADLSRLATREVGENGHSPFAELLLKVLKAEPEELKKDISLEAIIDDGVITAHELFTYLQNKLGDDAEKQTPGLFHLKKHDKGEYIFELPGFNEKKLEELKLDESTNPYKGLASFEKEDSQLFFGRKRLIEGSKEKEGLLEKVSKNQLTVVLGLSGSGKSSLVKAGLIPALISEEKTRWYVLEPMRPGELPINALASAILPIKNVDLVTQLAKVNFLDDILKSKTQQRQKSELNDENEKKFNILVKAWQGASPEAKLLLVLDYFEQLEKLCSDSEKQKLKKIYFSILETLNLLIKELQDSQYYLIEIIKGWSINNPNFRLIITIDQCEELMTLCKNEQEREDFLRLLAEAFASKELSENLRVVLTLRSEFEPQLRDMNKKKYENEVWQEAWQNVWQDGRFFVTPMDREELQKAIEEPAAQRALFFESPKLVNELIDEVVQMPGALPLLSFTLSELYLKYLKAEPEGRTDRTITDKDYREIGGVTRSLTQTADDTYKKLVNQEKVDESIIPHIMLRMVASSGGGLARRRVPVSELIYPDSKNLDSKNEQVQKIIQQFVEARLLVTGKNTENQDAENQDYVEPAHDALVRGWDLLQNWIAKLEQEKLPLQQRQRLTIDSFYWKRQGENKDALWKEDDLRIALLEKIINDKNKPENNWLNELETRFVEACVKNRDQEEEGRLDTSLEIGITSSQRLFDTGRKFDALTTLIKTGKSLNEQLEKYESSRLYFLISFRDMFGELEPCTSIAAHEGKVTSIGFNSHKNIMASSDSKTIKLWNADGTIRQTLERERGNEVEDLEFSRSGEFLAAADENGNIDLWQISKNSTEDTIEKNTFLFHKTFSRYHPANCIRFKPDDETLVSCDGSTVIRWTAESSSVDPLIILGDPTSKSNDDSATCVAFSPDGGMIAAGYAKGVVKLWKSDGCRIYTFKAAESKSVNSVNFSHNGETLVVGCANELQFWSTKKESIEPEVIRVLNADIRYVTFSPDDNLLALVDTKNIITLWLKNDRNWLNSDTQIKKLRILKHEDSYNKPIAKVCFLNKLDKSLSIAYNYGKTIQFWNCIDKLSGYCQDDEKFYGHTGTIMSIALSGDGKTIVTTSLDRTIKVWSNIGTLLETLHSGKQNYDPLDRVKISRDGQTIIVVLGIGKVIVWRKNENLRYDKIYEKEEFISEFDVSLSGNYCLTVSRDNGVMKVFGLLENRYQLIFEETNQAKVNFDYIGEVITSVNADKIVNIWRIKDGSLVKTISGFGNNVQYANFFHNDSLASADQKSWVVTIDGTSELNLWKVDGELERQVKRDIGARIVDLQFTGKTILILSESSTGEFYIELYSLSSTRIKTIPLAYGRLSTMSLNMDCKVIAVADSEVAHYENRVRLLNFDLANLEQDLVSLKSGIRSKFEIINEQMM